MDLELIFVGKPFQRHLVLDLFQKVEAQEENVEGNCSSPDLEEEPRRFTAACRLYFRLPMVHLEYHWELLKVKLIFLLIA